MSRTTVWLPILLLLSASLAGCLDDEGGETPNRPPEAVILFPTQGQTIEEGTQLLLDASASSDPDGNELEFFWTSSNEPGKEIGNLMTQFTTLTQAGTHLITLTVRDPGGLTAKDVRTIEVAYPNRSPVASILSPANGASLSEADDILFSHDSTDPDEGDTADLTVLWTLDGVVESNSDSFTRRLGAGNHVVVLTVEDPDGESSTVTHYFEVTNLPPVAVITAEQTSGFTGDLFEFSSADSYDPEGEVLDYSWEFGDGTTSDVESPTHAWDAPGRYRVNLTVEDEKRQNDTAWVNIDIASRGPSASFVMLDSNEEQTNETRVGVNLTLNASASEAMEGEIVNYTWDFGDGNVTTTNETSIEHNWTDAGRYNVTLTVEDDNGLTGEFSREVRAIPVDFHDEHSGNTVLLLNGNAEDDYPFPVEVFMETLELSLTINSDVGTVDYTFEVRTSEGDGFWNIGSSINGGESDTHEYTFDKDFFIQEYIGDFTIHLEIDTDNGASVNWDYIIDVRYA